MQAKDRYDNVLRTRIPALCDLFALKKSMPTICIHRSGLEHGRQKGDVPEGARPLGRAGRVIRVSSFYCTEPVGYPDQEKFLNAVAELETDLSPLALLAACHVIEDKLGREGCSGGVRAPSISTSCSMATRWSTPAELTIPHPLLAARRFVLVPLVRDRPPGGAPGFQERPIAQLLDELDDHAPRGQVRA